MRKRILDPDFPDPYHQVDDEAIQHTSLEVAAEVWATISGCRGKKGTFQVTANILLQKLYDELKRIGLTSYDPKRYERVVRTARVILDADIQPGEHGIPRSPECVGRAETPRPDDGCGATGVVHHPPRHVEPANPRRTSTGTRRKGETGKG